MGLIFNTIFVECVGVVVTLIVGYITYVKWSFNYWKRKNLPYLEPTIPFGNIENPITRKHYLGDWFKILYDQFKEMGAKHGGFYFFSQPAYMPVHPDALKNVMQRDFQYFVDRGFYHNEKDDPLSAHLFAIGGQKWRTLRTKLTPTFTSGKMKMMFDTLVQCGDQMQEAMDKFNKDGQPVDIKDVLARYTTDIIGSCAFGLECNSFKTPDAPFRKHGKKIFDPISKLRAVKNAFVSAYQEPARKLGLTFFDKDATAFFMKVVKDTVEYRETNNIVRKDIPGSTEYLTKIGPILDIYRLLA